MQMVLFIDSRQNRKREGVLFSREQTLAERHTCDSQLDFQIESTCVNFVQNKKDQTGFFCFFLKTANRKVLVYTVKSGRERKGNVDTLSGG